MRIINARLPPTRGHFVNKFLAYFTLSRLCEWQFKMRTGPDVSPPLSQIFYILGNGLLVFIKVVAGVGGREHKNQRNLDVILLLDRVAQPPTCENTSRRSEKVVLDGDTGHGRHCRKMA